MSEARVSPVNYDVRKLTELRAKARASFVERGEPIARWAVRRGFTPGMVHAVLRGDMKCDRGQAHQIAIALGLKPAPSRRSAA